MSMQPSPFYDLFERAYETILKFPVDEEGRGPHFDVEGNIDLSKGAELSYEPVQVVDLGGERYRMGDNSLVMSGVSLFWGDEFIANKKGDELELVKRLPSKFKHYDSIGKAKSLDVVHRYGGGWAQELMQLRVTIPIEQADAFEREIGLQETSSSEAPMIEASRHIVLLGDSIFDNAAYVPGEPPVIEQLAALLPSGWQSTLLAVDGDVTADVADQLKHLPPGVTHLVISVGGNDALGALDSFSLPSATVRDALCELTVVKTEFERNYRRMLRDVVSLGLPVMVCTIYDAVPGLSVEAMTALSIFNDTITRQAAGFGIPVIDLRHICSEASDYSEMSPIEPSAKGGGKIAQEIVVRLTQ